MGPLQSEVKTVWSVFLHGNGESENVMSQYYREVILKLNQSNWLVLFDWAGLELKALKVPQSHNILCSSARAFIGYLQQEELNF